LINENEAARDEDGWFVSSFTNGGGACVQIKFAERGMILVRDSKDRRAASPIVSIPSYSWVSMLRDVTKST
jgi:hypothetical protein